MADPNEPKKETVRIALPQEPVAKPRDTVRIQLPPRQSPNDLPHHHPLGAPRPPAEAVVPPSPFALPETSLAAAPEAVIPSVPVPGPNSGSVSAAPESVSPGPKKETARVPVMARTMPAPAVEMKKTQPLIAVPHPSRQSASMGVTPTEKAEESVMISAIPMPICWALLGVSTVILIIQIWTYLS
jgi:hypothetical protein